MEAIIRGCPEATYLGGRAVGRHHELGAILDQNPLKEPVKCLWGWGT